MEYSFNVTGKHPQPRSVDAHKPGTANVTAANKKTSHQRSEYCSITNSLAGGSAAEALCKATQTCDVQGLAVLDVNVTGVGSDAVVVAGPSTASVILSNAATGGCANPCITLELNSSIASSVDKARKLCVAYPEGMRVGYKILITIFDIHVLYKSSGDQGLALSCIIEMIVHVFGEIMK